MIITHGTETREVRQDLTGKRYGRLTVLRHVGWHKSVSLWLCKCDCGPDREKTVLQSSLLSGNTQSCGCLQKERASKAKKTHGKRWSSEYAIWCQMKNRCLSPKVKGYHNYGGRGIKVCGRWIDSFENFYADMGPRPSPKHSIDRIDNSGDYCPENCEWRTQKQQCRNTRTNRVLEFRGEKRTLIEWSEILGVRRCMIKDRLRRGWSAEEALSTPLKVPYSSTHVCEYCGKEFFIEESYKRGGRKVTCSKECRYKRISKMKRDKKLTITSSPD